MKSACLIVLSILILSIPVTAHAQATRTWVSGVGDDVNPCSRTAPCKTFAGAISKTATNGYINVIDPGGFGAVTITKSITIDGGPFHSGVLTTLGGSGVIVNGAGINVTLRNLDIEGANSGGNGVRILNASKVVIDRCNIMHFNAVGTGNGVSINTSTTVQVFIKDSAIHGNNNHGIDATTSSVIGKLHLENTRVFQNGQSGINLNANFQATINRSTLAQNGASGLVFVSATSNADVFETSIDNNGAGITTNTTNQVRLFGSQIVHNTTSISSATGVLTHGNNAIAGNGTNTQPSASVTPVAANGQQ